MSATSVVGGHRRLSGSPIASLVRAITDVASDVPVFALGSVGALQRSERREPSFHDRHLPRGARNPGLHPIIVDAGRP